MCRGGCGGWIKIVCACVDRWRRLRWRSAIWARLHAPLLYIFLSFVLTLSHILPTMFKLREILNFIEGKGAFHLATWRCNFGSQRVRSNIYSGSKKSAHPLGILMLTFSSKECCAALQCCYHNCKLLFRFGKIWSHVARRCRRLSDE